MEYEQAIRDAVWPLMPEGWGPTEKPVAMAAVFYRGDKRRVDVGNLEKPLCDALEGIYYCNDAQIMLQFLVKAYDKENPRLEFVFEEIQHDGFMAAVRRLSDWVAARVEARDEVILEAAE